MSEKILHIYENYDPKKPPVILRKKFGSCEKYAGQEVPRNVIEKMGAFSLRAAVRPPYAYGSCGNPYDIPCQYRYKNIPGVN